MIYLWIIRKDDFRERARWSHYMLIFVSRRVSIRSKILNLLACPSFHFVEHAIITVRRFFLTICTTQGIFDSALLLRVAKEEMTASSPMFHQHEPSLAWSTAMPNIIGNHADLNDLPYARTVGGG